MALNKSHVVDTALCLLREAGLPGMSMRTLATRLRVQPSALYWHFPSKQALLTAVAEQVLAGVGAVGAEDSAAEELRAVGRALRAAVAGVPDGAEIVALGLAAGATNPVAEAVGATCERHGLNDGDGAGGTGGPNGAAGAGASAGADGAGAGGSDGAGGLDGAAGRAAGLTTALTAYVLGLTIEEQTHHNLTVADPSMPAVDFDSRFAGGLEALLAGAGR